MEEVINEESQKAVSPEKGKRDPGGQRETEPDRKEKMKKAEENAAEKKTDEEKSETQRGDEPGKTAAEDPEVEETGEDAKEKPPKTGKKTGKKKDKRDEKIEELNDRLMRNLAEFENFRNRSEKEKSAMFEIGAKSVIEKILPVVDNLERGFDGLTEEERENPFVKGIEAVYKQMMTALDELGVKAIEAMGQEFDPNLHNAVMHDEDDSDESNKIIEEFQKGYMYKDSVVRHSMVKVLN